MRQQNRKGNFSKHTNNAYGYGNPNEYDHYRVEKPAQLLEWLMENVKGPSKTKVKQTLQGRGIKVDGKTITQFDYALKPGMKVSVSKTKKNQDVFKSRYLKIVYEDRYLIVIEKNVGILSMAAGPPTCPPGSEPQKTNAPIYLFWHRFRYQEAMPEVLGSKTYLSK